MTTVVEVALRQWAEEREARRRAGVTFILPRQAAGIIARVLEGGCPPECPDDAA